ncbi:MAG: hypothetical protein MJZ10_03860 [Fibrobacter sp.]|nr:hypothetical protein [Fibrobacter sp.]
MYETSYSLEANTPAVFATDYIVRSGGKSILDSALNNWFNSNTDNEFNKLKKSYTTLGSLQKKRPDLVPSNFVVLADGAAGLAIREYIQSADYKGEIGNVIFFNTPHEGTGFADQAIFTTSETTLDRGGDATKYVALLPMALIAYLAGGVDGLQEMMIALLKDAVMGMAYNVGDIEGGFENVFSGYSKDNASTWYLTQDASESDSKYTNLISGNEELLGSTQFLNSFSKNNNFDHPVYNVVYSYGLPAIGNGRRTLDDFVDQAKNHISTKKLASALADSLKNSEIFKNVKDDVEDIAKNIMNSQAIQEAMEGYTNNKDDIAKVVKAAQAINEIRKTGFNKNDIPGSVYKLLKIVDTFIPDSYKSEIYSLFMEYFTPENARLASDAAKCLAGSSSLKDCAREGVSVLASNLSNYSLNFFDNGSFDVPVYSAIGEGVAAFKEAGAARLGYELQDFLEDFKTLKGDYQNISKELDTLNEYRKLLGDIGELEIDRKVVDLALNVACKVVNKVNAAYGKICSAAEFATNVTLVGVTSYKIKKLAGNSSALKYAKDAALVAATASKDTISGNDYHGAGFSAELNDVEKMLFGSPKVALASVRKVDGSDTVIVPLMFSKGCKSSDIHDYTSMDTTCKPVTEIKLGDFKEPGVSQASTENMMVKDVSYGPDYIKKVKYGNLERFTAEDFIEEIHFQVDDFQPDSMRWVKLDFNTRVQIIYERQGDGNWYVYFEESYKKGCPIDTLSKSPISRDGRFVVNLQKVLKKYNDIPGNNTYQLGGLEEDGNNMVYVAAMNRIGRVYTGVFTFFFKATEFNYAAGWPRDYVEVTKLDSVSAFVNNMAYHQYSVDSVYLKVSYVQADTTLLDSVAAHFDFVETFKDSIAKDSGDATLWRLTCDLKKSLKRFSVDQEGEYLFEWNVIFKNSENDSLETFTFRTTAFVDKSAPGYVLNLKKDILVGDSTDGIWADLVTVDSLYEPARAVRAILLDLNGNVVVNPVYQKTRHSSKHMEMKWPASMSRLTSGKYLLLAQAYDFAVPDSVSYDMLLNINDSSYSIWDSVTKDSATKAGYNIFETTRTVWIDNVAPQVVNGTVSVNAVSDPSLPSNCATPKITGKTVANKCNLLSISFDVKEVSLPQYTSNVKITLVFWDSLGDGSVVKLRFLDALTFDSSDVIKFNYTESVQNRIGDGIYSVYAEMVDDAGNTSSTLIADSIIVDRTAPSVYNVNAGGTVYDSVAQMKTAYAYVMQNMDDVRNISTLYCKKMLNAGAFSSGWQDADTLIFTDKGPRTINFDIKSLATGFPEGSWTAYLGCYDAAGNFDSGLDFFNMGAMYPRITFPNDSINSMYYGKVLVRGVVPNPDLHGDAKKASFKLEWKGDGDTLWFENDSLNNYFEYLARDKNDKEGDIAIWNLDGVTSGLDTLRLSVKACDTCPWVSTATEVVVYDMLDPLHDSSETLINIKLANSANVGSEADILIELNHGSDTSAWDTSAWKVRSKITMYDPGETDTVVANEHVFDPAIVSPFKDKPATIDSGLYVWQEDSVWNVVWKGTAKGVIMDSSVLVQKLDATKKFAPSDTVKRAVPRLALKFVDSTMAIADSFVKKASVDTTEVPAIDVGGISMPAFDRNVSWRLDSLTGDSLHIQFTTDSAFTIDLSSVDYADSLIYVGKRHAYEALASFKGVGMLNVHPEQFYMHHYWKGVGDGGRYAGGDSAHISVVAYNKNDPSRIVTKDFSWILNYDEIKLVAGRQPANLYFNLGAPDSVPFKRNEIVFTYGLHGRSAYVTEEILDAKGNVVRTFKNREFVYAGESTNANKVVWNGERSGGTVADDLGTYTIRVTAYEKKDDTVAKDRLETRFMMQNNATLVAADTTGGLIDLSLDEAYLDSAGDLRYVGSIDYLMKNRVSANYLPEINRKFYYKWNYENGIQTAAIYKKYRFSAGFHRHRDKFPVTVAVLLVSEGFGVKSVLQKISECNTVASFLTGGLSCITKTLFTCSTGDNRHPYTIKVFKTNLEKGRNGEFDVVLKGPDVVGYNANISSGYPIVAGVKVMPVDVMHSVGGFLGDSLRDTVVVSGFVEDLKKEGSVTFESLWDATISSQDMVTKYKDESHLQAWFNNFGGQAVFWETGKRQFKEEDEEFDAEYPNMISTCTVDTSANAADSNFVCGPKNAEDATKVSELEKYNPHSRMLKISFKYIDGTTFSLRDYSAPTGCGDYEDSGSQVGVKLVLKVDSAYWSPAWGYNNLANRYVRFDPTNKTLYGDGGYFKANYRANDSLPFTLAEKLAYKNHFGVNGWEFSYDSTKAYLSPFEAERFPMRQVGMNPLLFSDEINASIDSLSESDFIVKYFKVGGNDKFGIVVRDSNGVKLELLYSVDAARAHSPLHVKNPLDVSFLVAPVVSINEALVGEDNDGVLCRYPCSDDSDSLNRKFEKTRYYDAGRFAFYTDFRSRIHKTVGDWDDSDWKMKFVVGDSIAKNPVTFDSLYFEYGNVSYDTPKKKSLLDSVFVYIVKNSDTAGGKWKIPYDSIMHIDSLRSEFGKGMGAVNGAPKLKEVDSLGKDLSETVWSISSASVGFGITYEGVKIDTSMNYVFSKDTLTYDMKNRIHQVPFENILAQNGADSLLSNQWVMNFEIQHDSLCERDTNMVEDSLRKHEFLSATYDTTNSWFNVTWNGKSPTVRQNEIGTFRGRVPGNNAKWTLTYVNNGRTYFADSGTQEKFPSGKTYPVLTRFNMNKLQGNTSFFLQYGNENSISYYRKLDVIIGTRVNPGDSAFVQTMYANASVEFDPDAWGGDTVDVTIRSVDGKEYVYGTFNGLAVNGPVIEVLPSHDFGDDESLWPTIKIKLSREDVSSVGLDVDRLKIYKPDTASRKIVPLETNIYECFSDVEMNTMVNCSDSTWNYVILKAKTKTFSSFVVLDTNVAKTFVPADTVPDVDSLSCRALAFDTLWMGTYNGRLEYPSPCVGRSNYLLQLRVGASIAAEHQGVNGNLLVWEARRRDIWLKSDIYTSRAEFFALDGKSEQVAGPFVRIDSIAPVMNDVNLSVEESGSDRILNVSGAVADSMSGISKVTFNVYYGGYVVESRSVFYSPYAKDSSFSENFTINGKILRDCLGCKASVKVKVEDAGHNYVEDRFATDPFYPYPTSLVLWYPLSEGYGNVAHEVTGSGLHLGLGNVSKPWAYGGKVNFAGITDNATSSGYLVRDEETPFSVEFRGIVGFRNGALVSDLAGRWNIHVENGGLYVDDGIGNVRLSANVGTGVQRHYVFVFEGSALSLYVDGEFVERVGLSRDVVMGENFKPYLGSAKLSSFFRIGDLRIYGSALSADQVRDLHHYEYVPDETEKVIVTRATDIDDREGLVVDQSCALPGKSYLRQKNASSEGLANWNVEADAGDYSLYLLVRGYSIETSLVEVFVNNVSYGVHCLRSSGYWETVRVGDSLRFPLSSGSNVVSVRPVGGIGLAGLAVVSSPKEFDVSKLDFGQSVWSDPEPRVEVRLSYENAGDKTWARPRVQLRNLTGESFANAHFRYYYEGEGSAVQAKSFWPDLPMAVVPDAGNVYYADLALTEPIAPYGSIYNGAGLQLGLHRADYYQPWNILDDPSYEQGAESGYVLAKGVALLDEDGGLLNDWSCHDDGKTAERPKPSVRVLAKDLSWELNRRNEVQVVVENDGTVAVDGFEVLYYYRDAQGDVADPEYYDTTFAKASHVAAGGDLYYISFMYKNVVLNPGERNAFGNGAKFALHNSDWGDGFNANDDPSHHGLGRDFAVADSIVVLDRNGNLLYGGVPQPRFADSVVVKNVSESRVTRVGDVVYVEIDAEGYYTLEIENAVGAPQAKLFEGKWGEGTHMVVIPADKLKQGGYLVLRNGNVILNWQIFK